MENNFIDQETVDGDQAGFLLSVFDLQRIKKRLELLEICENGDSSHNPINGITSHSMYFLDVSDSGFFQGNYTTGKSPLKID